MTIILFITVTGCYCDDNPSHPLVISGSDCWLLSDYNLIYWIHIHSRNWHQIYWWGRHCQAGLLLVASRQAVTVTIIRAIPESSQAQTCWVGWIVSQNKKSWLPARQWLGRVMRSVVWNLPVVPYHIVHDINRLPFNLTWYTAQPNMPWPSWHSTISAW